MPDTTPITATVHADTAQAVEELDALHTKAAIVPTRPWWRSVFSDGDQPSSSRVLTFVLALAVVGILIGVFRHVCKIQDAATLGLWLVNLPLIIAALVGLTGAPYAINRASGSVSDIIAALRRKD